MHRLHASAHQIPKPDITTCPEAVQFIVGRRRPGDGVVQLQMIGSGLRRSAWQGQLKFSVSDAFRRPPHLTQQFSGRRMHLQKLIYKLSLIRQR